MRSFIAMLTKKLIGLLFSRSSVIGFLEVLTEKSKPEFDDELLELGIAVYDGDHEGIVKNAEDLIAAIKRDWAKR
jgi:hypothetical protein